MDPANYIIPYEFYQFFCIIIIKKIIENANYKQYTFYKTLKQSFIKKNTFF